MLDAEKLEKVKQGLFRCFMKCNEPFAVGCGQCPYVGMCYPSANEYESPETAALYTETVALIDELVQEIEQLRAKLEQETKTQPTAARQVSTKKYGAWKGDGGT